jgi:hypothetical protein
VAAIRKTADGMIVVVLPITHAPPAPSTLAMEIPPTTKARLGLDDERSWVIFSEANRFRWPGPDLRPSRNGDLSSVAYGELPATMFRRLRDDFLRAYQNDRAVLMQRTE